MSALISKNGSEPEAGLASINDQVAAALAKITKPTGGALLWDVEVALGEEPASHWTDHVAAVARELAGGVL